MTFESEAMPHSWMQYVIEGTTIAEQLNFVAKAELARWPKQTVEFP